jgi:hypothetical protein
MPPKKFTKREERNDNRERLKYLSEAAKEKALLFSKQSKQSSMSTSARTYEKRALKAALAAEGISLRAWGAVTGAEDQSFVEAAKERFVLNHRYVTLESNWDDVTFGVPSSTVTECEVLDNAVQRSSRKRDNRRRNKKTTAETMLTTDTASAPTKSDVSSSSSSRHAKSAINRVSSEESISPETSTATDPVDAPKASKELAVERPLPLGKVCIINRAGFPLTAEPAGRLMWNRTKVSDWEKWTIEIAPGDIPVQVGGNRKYTLRSYHGKYLCHCLLWGFVADRESASDWEYFTLDQLPVEDDALSHGANPTSSSHRSDRQILCSMKSWRGAFLTSPQNDVTKKNGFVLSDFEQQGNTALPDAAAGNGELFRICRIK